MIYLHTISKTIPRDNVYCIILQAATVLKTTHTLVFSLVGMVADDFPTVNKVDLGRGEA